MEKRDLRKEGVEYVFWAIVSDENIKLIKAPRQLDLSTEDLITQLQLSTEYRLVTQSEWDDRIILHWLNKGNEALNYQDPTTRSRIQELFPEKSIPVRDLRAPFTTLLPKPYINISENRKLFKELDQAIEEEKSFEQRNIEINHSRTEFALEHQQERDEESIWNGLDGEIEWNPPEQRVYDENTW